MPVGYFNSRIKLSKRVPRHSDTWRCSVVYVSREQVRLLLKGSTQAMLRDDRQLLTSIELCVCVIFSKIRSSSGFLQPGSELSGSVSKRCVGVFRAIADTSNSLNT